MTTTRFKYLRPEDIRHLQSYEFAPRALVEGYLAGRHRSHAQGTSTEFRDYRQYVPGDDLGLVDWRVFARTDRYYLRTYNQETNMNGYVFLDSSLSMGFGEPHTKLEYASFFAASLCYLVLKSLDRVSLHVFDEEIREFVPPGSTQRHLQNLMHVLERNQPGRKTAVANALRRAFPLLHQRGVLVIISDFFDNAADIFSALNPYLHRGFTVYLCHVLAPEELELPDRGLVTFRDMETQRRIVAHTGSLRTRYREAIQSHMQALRELATRRQVKYVVARTDASFYHLFDHFIS